MSNPEASFCGDFCGKCPNYPDECGGCGAADRTECFFVKCCMEKGLKHCGLCGDFPCGKLRDFVPDDRPECTHGYHIGELRRRKAMGTEAWLAAQREKWKRLG